MLHGKSRVVKTYVKGCCKYLQGCYKVALGAQGWNYASLGFGPAACAVSPGIPLLTVVVSGPKPLQVCHKKHRCLANSTNPL